MPDVSVLLVDEPTRGVDVGGRAAIHRLLREAAEQGQVVIFASSELDELLELAETIVTMRSGRVISTYTEGASRGGAPLRPDPTGPGCRLEGSHWSRTR